MKQILLLLLAIAPVVAIAQPNYHEGYILKNNGDTLKGFINYRERALSPREIEFKKIEVSVAYTSFTTSAGYAGVEVSNKSSTNFGIKMLFN